MSCNHGDNCLDSAKDYGVTTLYDTIVKMANIYKGKKQIILKNDNGDTLNLRIKYSTFIANDTVASTLRDNGSICTAEVRHINFIALELFRKDSSFYVFYLYPKSDFDYVLKRVSKKQDEVSRGWLQGDHIGVNILDIYINDPSVSKIPYKNMVINGKNTQVIDSGVKTLEPTLIDDKGIVAMIIPNHGSGYWVVDKIE